MNAYAVGDRPSPFGSSPSSSTAGKTGVPPLVSDMCRCRPLPVRSANGLGMKVATMPRSAAIIDSR